MTLTDLLTGEGFGVETAQDGRKGFELATSEPFDLILLDVMLPGMNGFDLCRDLRQRSVHTPVLMLTARGELEDRVKGLKLGADDYLPKPFAIPELLARIQALLRRAATPGVAPRPSAFRFGRVTVDFRSTQVRKDGKPVEMSAREFQLLCYLIDHAGETISRRQLLRDVWHYDFPILTRTVDVHFGLLRQKLDPEPKNPRYFLTQRGLGYRFAGEAKTS